MQRPLLLALVIVGSASLASAATVVTCDQVNDRTDIQRAIATADAVVVKGDICLIDGQIRVDANTTFTFASETVVRRNWNGGSGWDGALIGQANFNSKVNNVVVEGGAWEGNDKTGRVINWYGDAWTVQKMNIKSWGKLGTGSRAITWVGNDTVITGNHLRGAPDATGFGGIVMGGGRGALISHNDVVAGDDAFACFPNASGILQDENISDVLFLHNLGRSTAARAFACGVHESFLTATVANIRVTDFIGESESNQIITLIEEGGALQDLYFDNLTLTGDGVYVAIGFRIHEADRVFIDRASISGATDAAMKTINFGKTLRVENSALDGSSGQHAIEIQGGGQDITVTGNTLVGGADHVILFSENGNRLQDFWFVRNHVSAIASDKAGIRVNDGANLWITDNLFVEASGAVNSFGISYNPTTCTGLVIRDNDTSRVDN